MKTAVDCICLEQFCAMWAVGCWTEHHH